SDPRDLDGAAAAFGSFAGRVAASGFTADELREFSNLGLSQATVDGLRATIASQSPFIFSRATLTAQLNDLITANNTAAAGLATVASDMQGIVNILESNSAVPQRTPLARAGGGYTAAEGAPVRLDGTASSDPGGTIVSWQWDLNLDGVFDDATGPTPTVTFAQAFDGLVGLRVTDDHGRTGIGYARMTVTDVNRPPVIVTRSPAAPLLGVDVGASLPFAVTANDPDA